MRATASRFLFCLGLLVNAAMLVQSSYAQTPAAPPQPSSDEPLTLNAGELAITFDLSQKGGVRSLRYEALDVVSQDVKRPTVFAIDVVTGDRVRRFDNNDFRSFRKEDIPDGVRLLYADLPETPLDVVLEIHTRGETLVFQSEVRCGAETVCAGLEYPYISGYASLSGDPAQDHYIFPHLTGQDITDPGRVRRTVPEAFSRQGYPGTQGMQFHALHNDQAGLVMYAADDECRPKLFDLFHHRGQDNIAWTLRHYFDETPGFAFRQEYEGRVQGCGPTWYDAADIYADWSRQQSWMQKKVRRPEWLDAPPMIAHVHDNQNYARMRPSWFAEHQPEMNELLDGHVLINNLGQWEHYGMWIAPDSFPPFGGEEEMVRATRAVRETGNHIKHLFSCGKYWLHPDITDENFDEIILEAVALPRGPVNRERLIEQFPMLGKNVNTCPSSEFYQDKLAHLAEKLLDYHHDVFSMDIWPVGQPHVCHNPRHDHPPGLGKWFVEANTALVERLQAIAFAENPDAVFGGESMAEPYLPYMHLSLMRSVEAPLVRDRHGRPAGGIRIPLFDYVYGDQVQEWNGRAMTQLSEDAGTVGLQLARGCLLHITDKWHHKYFDADAMGMSRDHQPGDPVPTPILRIELGGPEVRRQNLLFAAKANDLQRGEFSSYFTRGRPGRYPHALARTGDHAEWRALKLYDQQPAIGTLRHPTEESILWVCVNGKDQSTQVRIQKPDEMAVARSRHEQPIRDIDVDGMAFVELDLQPREIVLLEWN